MPEYYNVTTNLGDAEIANAIATNTKLNITHIAFGDGNGSVPTPNKARTSLVREVHRQAVTKYERHPTNANWIVIETIIPSGIGGFTIREMGIIANEKLISHGSHAPFEKVADPSGVSEYRLRFTQNVTDGSVVELRLDESLIYATQAWIDENYIKRSEIVDNLTTDDADKVASAAQVKILNDDKANKTTTLTAGNGLSGGGTLEINRTLTLGTPSKITGSTTNSVTATSHTHEIDNASTSVAGVVKLNNTLTSTSTSEAATANTVKLLNDRFVNDFLSLKSENGYQKLPDGLIIQWGLSTGASSRTATFPIAFPNECLNISGSTYLPLGNFQTCSFRNATNQNFGIQTGDVNNVAQPNPVKWFAIGY